MPEQVRKQSPTSQDSGTRVSLAGQDATVYREKERDGGAYSELYPPACVDRYSPTFIRLALHQAPVAVVGVPGRR
jgi:hypothetical protein